MHAIRGISEGTHDDVGAVQLEGFQRFRPAALGGFAHREAFFAAIRCRGAAALEYAGGHIHQALLATAARGVDGVQLRADGFGIALGHDGHGQGLIHAVNAVATEGLLDLGPADDAAFRHVAQGGLGEQDGSRTLGTGATGAPVDGVPVRGGCEQQARAIHMARNAEMRRAIAAGNPGYAQGAGQKAHGAVGHEDAFFPSDDDATVVFKLLSYEIDFNAVHDGNAGHGGGTVLSTSGFRAFIVTIFFGGGLVVHGHGSCSFDQR